MGSCKNLIIVGMGGAINNPLSIINFKKSQKLNIIPLFSTDPELVSSKLHDIDFRETICIAISNSGETFETNAITKYLAYSFTNAGLNLAKHFYFIVGQGNNSLRRFATELSAQIIDYTPGIGGRFSFFSPVGYLPALLAGADLEALIAGANEIIENFHLQREESHAVKSATAIYSSEKHVNVLMNYSANLDALSDLYIQLVAESLSKDGKGLIPIKATGPQDQHVLLQQFLDGPPNSFFTTIKLNNLPKLKYTTQTSIEENLSELHSIMCDATIMTLREKHYPMRTIIFNELKEYQFGQLLMQFYTEVIVLGTLLEINPFNQPGVELMKAKVSAKLQELL